jgi:putative protease
LELVTLSPELSARQLERAVAKARLHPSAPLMELMVEGNLEVMVAEDCFLGLAKGRYDAKEFWGLQDMRRIFPLRLDDERRTHIFNSAETCLLDRMPQLFKIGLDGLAIDARGRTQEYARQMTEIYGKAIELTEKAAKSLPEDLQALKEEIRPLALGGITYGHFIKGLKDELR